MGKMMKYFLLCVYVCVCVCVRSHPITVTFTVFALGIGISHMPFHLSSCLSYQLSWMWVRSKDKSLVSALKGCSAWGRLIRSHPTITWEWMWLSVMVGGKFWQMEMGNGEVTGDTKVWARVPWKIRRSEQEKLLWWGNQEQMFYWHS